MQFCYVISQKNPYIIMYSSKESMSLRDKDTGSWKWIGSRTNVTILFVSILGVYSEHVVSVNTLVSDFFSESIIPFTRVRENDKKMPSRLTPVSRQLGVFRIFNYNSHGCLFSRTTICIRAKTVYRIYQTVFALTYIHRVYRRFCKMKFNVDKKRQRPSVR